MEGVINLGNNARLTLYFGLITGAVLVSATQSRAGNYVTNRQTTFGSVGKLTDTQRQNKRGSIGEIILTFIEAGVVCLAIS